MRLALLLLCTACAPSDALEPLRLCVIDPPERGVLEADGTELRDAHGRIVTLRGINAGGRSKFAPYFPFEWEDPDFVAAMEDYLDRIDAFGFDVLRVPFSWAAFEPVRGVDDGLWATR